MKLQKTLWLLFIYFSFMPWVSFRIIDMDTQPYFIIISIMILLLNCNKKFDLRILYLLALSVASVIVGVAYGYFDGGVIRSIATYSTPFLVTIAFYMRNGHYKNNFKFHLLLINVLWLIAAVLQKLLGPYIFSSLLEVRTSPGRGVTSLAPEPTHFAIYLIFVSWIICKVYDYKNIPLKVKYLLLINALSVVFLAKSSMGVLLMLIIALGYSVCNFRFTIKKCLFGVVFFLLTNVLVMQISKLEDSSRLSNMVNLVKDAGVINLLMTDESVNLRVKAIAHSVYGTFDNNFIPQGFHKYNIYSTELSGESGSVFWTRSNSDKIMSGLGAPLFELGVFGLFLFFYIFSVTIFQNNKRIAIFEIIFIPMIMFTAITVSFPLFLILLALNLKNKSVPYNA